MTEPKERPKIVNEAFRWMNEAQYKHPPTGQSAPVMPPDLSAGLKDYVRVLEQTIAAQGAEKRSAFEAGYESGWTRKSAGMNYHLEFAIEDYQQSKAKEGA